MDRILGNRRERTCGKESGALLVQADIKLRHTSIERANSAARLLNSYEMIRTMPSAVLQLARCDIESATSLCASSFTYSQVDVVP